MCPCSGSTSIDIYGRHSPALLVLVHLYDLQRTNGTANLDKHTLPVQGCHAAAQLTKHSNERNLQDNYHHKSDV